MVHLSELRGAISITSGSSFEARRAEIVDEVEYQSTVDFTGMRGIAQCGSGSGTRV
jgi:hypothetical protein